MTEEQDQSIERLVYESQAEVGEFCLHVARRAQADLEVLDRAEAKPGGWDRSKVPFERVPPSDHYRHAVVCTVFSAAAADHVLAGLALFRKRIGSRMPERRLIEAVWPRVLSGRALVNIARVVSPIDHGLLGRVEALMTRRNRLVHSQAEDWEAPDPDHPGTARGVDFQRLEPQVIDDATADLAIAEELVAAAKKAMGDPEWNPFR